MQLWATNGWTGLRLSGRLGGVLHDANRVRVTTDMCNNKYLIGVIFVAYDKSY